MAEVRVGSGKVALFCQEAPRGVTYRIPALLYLPRESMFLAFAEKRSSFKDEDAEFLVMRRGRKEGASVQWGPQEPLTTAILPGHRTMNPCPVYEKKRGRVFLFFICVRTHVTEWQQIRSGRNAARLCYVSSQDGGRTWSQLTDLTDQVIGEDLRNWATFAVGPGHGLQTSSGRLVIPAYTYYIHKRCFGHSLLCWTKPHCFLFYSDDLGQKWVQGQLLKNLRTTECQVAEVTCQGENQVLYCSARSPDKSRVEAFSLDHGDRFEESFLCKELCEPPKGCQGSVVSFTPTLKPTELGRIKNAGESTHLVGIHFPSASAETSQSWLVFSHPTNRCRRVNLGIYINTSPLDKGCWKSPWMLYEGPCGYSDLAVCEDGRSLLFGCLFECGASSECEEIAFQLFTDAELLRNVREGCSCAASPSEEQVL
ncbi:PREDICTED: sialidase-3 [Gekko japonicus]|uniref:exo-alpha-sialidase n=1 Tax=Gekko japonicus TaxID=146911 RepID=A0ABM1K7G1_GEKJA|nr:PREDICTED: sialidase-3 [Gekko japonicus]